MMINIIINDGMFSLVSKNYHVRRISRILKDLPPVTPDCYSLIIGAC